MSTSTMTIPIYAAGFVDDDTGFPIVSMRDHKSASFSTMLTGTLAGKLRIETSDFNDVERFIPTTVEVEVSGKTKISLEKETGAHYVRLFFDHSSGEGTVEIAFTGKAV